jgi:hypothetical protein
VGVEGLLPQPASARMTASPPRIGIDILFMTAFYRVTIY